MKIAKCTWFCFATLLLFGDKTFASDNIYEMTGQVESVSETQFSIRVNDKKFEFKLEKLDKDKQKKIKEGQFVTVFYSVNLENIILSKDNKERQLPGFTDPDDYIQKDDRIFYHVRNGLGSHSDKPQTPLKKPS